MRKMFWALAAGGLMLAGGLGAVAQHAASHPDSGAARWLTGVSRMTILLNPVTGLAPVLAEKVWHTGTPQGCEEAQECCAGAETFPEPVAIEEPAGLDVRPLEAAEPIPELKIG